MYSLLCQKKSNYNVSLCFGLPSILETSIFTAKTGYFHLKDFALYKITNEPKDKY